MVVVVVVVVRHKLIGCGCGKPFLILLIPDIESFRLSRIFLILMLVKGQNYLCEQLTNISNF